MALIQFTAGVNNSLRVQRWAKELWHVHQRDQFFYHHTSKDTTNVVHEKLDFTKEAGYQMTEGLMMQFVGEGVINDETLENQEEAPDFYNMTWTISQVRNAARCAGEETVQQVEYSLPSEFRDGLGEWMANRRDKDVFWQCGNSPTKIIYVNSRAGTNALVAGDLLTLTNIIYAKTYAYSTAYPKIPPIKISKIGKQTIYRYLFLLHDHVAYDLQINDPVYQQVARDAGKRGDENWLIQGALMDWGGVSLFPHDNCPISSTWGASSNVYGAESYLLGRQAIIVGIGGYRMQGKNGFLKWVEKKFDYDNQFGVAVGIIKGETKSQYNSKDWAEIAIRSARTNIS